MSNRDFIWEKISQTTNRCFIVAEAGVNHNGDVNLAKKLIDAAVDAGADAVKFQVYTAEAVAAYNSKIAGYQRKNIGSDLSQVEMLKKYELKHADFIKIKDYCDNKGIIFLATPHSLDAVDFLEPLVPAYKVGSGDLTNTPLLEKIAKKGKPMIVGTGMSTLDEVKAALKAIYSTGNREVVMLHCTTNYPCPIEEVNLRAMKQMQDELDCLVGYSDHTLGLTLPIMAVALGAAVIEKHLTLDRTLPGPDHAASLEPSEFKEMVLAIRGAESALGDKIKEPTENEKKIMPLVRKSLMARVDIPKGAVITENMLSIKRPGTGLSPSDIKKIIGRKTTCDIKADELLTYGKIE